MKRTLITNRSRALTTTKKLVHDMQHIDRPLWDRMRALTESGLSQHLSRWLDRDQIKALLDRRDKLQQEIDGMVRKKGAVRVFIS